MRKYFLMLFYLFFQFLFPTSVFSQDQYSEDIKKLNLLKEEKNWFDACFFVGEIRGKNPEHSTELFIILSQISNRYSDFSDVDLLLEKYDFKPIKYEFRTIRLSGTSGCIQSYFFEYSLSFEKNQVLCYFSVDEDPTILMDVENLLKLTGEFIDKEDPIEYGGLFSTADFRGTLYIEYEYQGEMIEKKYPISFGMPKDKTLYLILYYLFKKLPYELTLPKEELKGNNFLFSYDTDLGDLNLDDLDLGDLLVE